MLLLTAILATIINCSDGIVVPSLTTNVTEIGKSRLSTHNEIGSISGPVDVGDDVVVVGGGAGANLILPLFVAFVVVVFLFHFYLKYDEHKKMKKRNKENQMIFQWKEDEKQ